MSDEQDKAARDELPHLENIKAELRKHNEDIGADGRDEDRLASDARFVHMVRHEGIEVETLAMMATDGLFAAKALRAEVEQLRGEVNARGKILDDLQKEAGTGWWYGVLDVLKQLRRERDLAEATNEALVDDAKSLNATFDLRHDADMRAIARWREAHPGSELVMPDHADLCVWLLEQLAAATARAEQAEGERERMREAALTVMDRVGRAGVQGWSMQQFLNDGSVRELVEALAESNNTKGGK